MYIDNPKELLQIQHLKYKLIIIEFKLFILDLIEIKLNQGY